MKRFVCNVSKNNIVYFNELAIIEVFLVVLYRETDEVEIFKLKVDNLKEVDMQINKKNDTFTINKFYSLSPLAFNSPYKVNSIKFSRSNRFLNTYNTLNVSLKNGNSILINLKKDSKEEGATLRQSSC